MRKVLHRLDPLLSWVNEAGYGPDAPSDKEVHKLLAEFVKSFDGSPDSGFIEATAQPWEPVGFMAGNFTEDDELDLTRGFVEGILQQGFEDRESLPQRHGGIVPLTSLSFGVRNRRQRPPANRRARRTFMAAPGSYVMQVRGQVRDLVPFLVLQVLIAPGGATLARCPAPERYKPQERCGRFFVTGGRGQPRKFCSTTCRVRAHFRRDV